MEQGTLTVAVTVLTAVRKYLKWAMDFALVKLNLHRTRPPTAAFCGSTRLMKDYLLMLRRSEIWVFSENPGWWHMDRPCSN